MRRNEELTAKDAKSAKGRQEVHHNDTTNTTRKTRKVVEAGTIAIHYSFLLPFVVLVVPSWFNSKCISLALLASLAVQTLRF
jgi:hypothetical protein